MVEQGLPGTQNAGPLDGGLHDAGPPDAVAIDRIFREFLPVLDHGFPFWKEESRRRGTNEGKTQPEEYLIQQCGPFTNVSSSREWQTVRRSVPAMTSVGDNAELARGRAEYVLELIRSEDRDSRCPIEITLAHAGPEYIGDPGDRLRALDRGVKIYGDVRVHSTASPNQRLQANDDAPGSPRSRTTSTKPRSGNLERFRSGRADDQLDRLRWICETVSGADRSK